MAKAKTPRRSGPKASASLELHERVTVLETLHMANAETTKQLVASVEAIQTSLTRYQGFWGAVTLIGTAMWGAVTLFKDNIVSMFGSK